MSIFFWRGISETIYRAKRCKECKERIEKGELEFIFFEDRYLMRYHVECEVAHPNTPFNSGRIWNL